MLSSTNIVLVDGNPGKDQMLSVITCGKLILDTRMSVQTINAANAVITQEYPKPGLHKRMINRMIANKNEMLMKSRGRLASITRFN